MTRPSRRERGTGLIGSLAGLLVISALLSVAVQVSADLAVTSSVAAVGHDAVRRVASSTVEHEDSDALAAAQRRAEAGVERHLLGSGRPELRWTVSEEWVRLTISVERPRLGPQAVRSALGPRTIERTFQARLERPPR